jgi:hypothetical protein
MPNFTSQQSRPVSAAVSATTKSPPPQQRNSANNKSATVAAAAAATSVPTVNGRTKTVSFENGTTAGAVGSARTSKNGVRTPVVGPWRTTAAANSAAAAASNHKSPAAAGAADSNHEGETVQSGQQDIYEFSGEANFVGTNWKLVPVYKICIKSCRF